MASSSSRRFLMFSMSFTVLLPDCLRTTSVTVFCPFNRDRVRGSSMSSVMVAMVPSGMGWPPTFATMRLLKSATVFMRPSVRTTSSRAPCWMRPPGTSMFCWARASCTSCTVSPKARRRWKSNATCTARVRAPEMLMAPTSGTVSRFCFSCLSAMYVTSFSSRGALTLTDSTGTESRSNLSMIGGSVPSGNRARMEFTLSRTSCAAASRSRS